MSKIKIDLPSRYRDVISSLEQTDDPLVFKLNTNSHYIRCGFKPDSKERTFVDLEGGPFISIGNDTIFEGHKLKDIVEAEEGFKFIFEKNEDKE